MKLEKALFGKIFLVIFTCILVTSFYKGVITPPSEGDSVDYHIPLAKAVLSGQIFDPASISVPSHTKFYPANFESVLSLFILLNIPLGLFNFFGIILLFLCSLRLGRSFKLDVDMSIIFAVTVSTLNGVIRWADTQIIDIYLLSFFLLVLSFLERPKNKTSYFIKLGVFTGIIIGSKFSAPFISFVLFLVYIPRIFKYINFKNVITFFIPVILFGGLWFVRNYFYTENPFYPQAFLFFEGLDDTILSVSVLNILTGPLSGVIGTLNAFISEYLVWAVMIPITLVYFLIKRKEKIFSDLPKRLLLISLLIFLLAINLPSSHETHIMVSSFRYFYTSIIPLILFTFLLFDMKKWGIAISVISLTGILLVEFPLGYYPKLLFIAIPVALVTYYFGYGYLVKIIKKW